MKLKVLLSEVLFILLMLASAISLLLNLFMIGLETHLDHNELFVRRAPIIVRETESLAQSIGMSVDDLAMVHLGLQMGASINANTRLDLSDYDDTIRLKFSKEFSRLLDASHGNQGPTPSFGMSVLFKTLPAWESDGFPKPRNILSATIRANYCRLVGAAVIFDMVDQSSVAGIVSSIGPTRDKVDRRAYYEQFYDDLNIHPMNGGHLPVREHVAILDDGENRVDLDAVDTLTVVYLRDQGLRLTSQP